jgi:hypothetical protein
MTAPATRPTLASRPTWLLVVAVLATAFGILTLIASSRVLFGSAAARAAEGDYVPFVLWFNFLAGFAYVAAGVSLGLARPWAGRLALGIAVATAIVYAALGVHILIGGRFTLHTVRAMAVRTIVWSAIAVVACRRLVHARAASALPCSRRSPWSASTSRRGLATRCAHAGSDPPRPDVRPRPA